MTLFEDELRSLRADPSTWDKLAVYFCHTEERGTYDNHAQFRYRALLALQHDRRDSDLALVRHAFRQEVQAAENDSFQGYDDAYTLAAFLLARFRKPQDIVLFARAKLANFDTGCGFPLEFLYYVGGEDFEAILKARAPELWDALASRFELAFDAAAVDDFWQRLGRDFPESEEDETTLSLYERAMAFGDETEARRQLERWASSQSESEHKRSVLQHEYARLGDPGRAADVATQALAHCTTDWDRAAALRSVIALNRAAERYALASAAARQLDATFCNFDDWIGVGLGRMAIHETFELAAAHPDPSEARAIFALADGWYARSNDLALVGLEAAVRAAQHCELSDATERYEKLATAERTRIEIELRDK